MVWTYPTLREAKRLGRANPKTSERRSLRKIAAELAKIGEALAATGTPGAKEAARAYGLSRSCENRYTDPMDLDGEAR